VLTIVHMNMTINRLLILAPTSRFTLIEVDIGEHCQLKNENRNKRKERRFEYIKKHRKVLCLRNQFAAY
jgi:hypothetical protein